MFKTITCKHIVLFYLLAMHLVRATGSARNKRFLIFPEGAPTRHQFIGGIGIPVDLEYESLTSGYVLKAMYWLPYNETHFRENPYLPEYKNELPNVNNRAFGGNHHRERRSTLRWDIYDILSERLSSYGYKGQECVMKAICEANAMTFVRHYDVFGELMHILFSPSTSRDMDTEMSQNFKEAEKQGASLGDCDIYESLLL
uniref:Phospholipid/glycerol acyltransferase domain-containing protein n=1 Tax=Stomoxys calcitrans TaxID=35570 RepID=A0A1I8NY31_STOCA